MNTNEPTTPSAIRSGEPLWCADCKSYHPIGLHTGTPSAPPTEGSAVEWAQTKMITREDIDGDLFKCLQEDDAIELARRADEARAELARLKANNRYQRGYHDGEQAAREELKTPAPPTEGSAVEWVEKRLEKLYRSYGEECDALLDDDALELARSADEVEAKHEAFRDAIRTKEANELAALSEVDTLRAKLAAAQTEARELREALADMHSGWRYIRAVYGDLAGVGWDRAEQKARAALAKKEGER